jgi:hypothetical protein
MRATITVLLLALGTAACGDDLKPAQHDAGVDPDAAPDAPTTNVVGPCLDRPDRLDTTPTGQLPCELISPGFQP